MKRKIEMDVKGTCESMSKGGRYEKENPGVICQWLYGAVSSDGSLRPGSSPDYPSKPDNADYSIYSNHANYSNNSSDPNGERGGET